MQELEQELAMAQVELAVSGQGDLQAVAFRAAEALEVAAYRVVVAFQYLSSSFYLAPQYPPHIRWTVT